MAVTTQFATFDEMVIAVVTDTAVVVEQHSETFTKTQEVPPVDMASIETCNVESHGCPCARAPKNDDIRRNAMSSGRQAELLPWTIVLATNAGAFRR